MVGGSLVVLLRGGASNNFKNVAEAVEVLFAPNSIHSFAVQYRYFRFTLLVLDVTGVCCCFVVGVLTRVWKGFSVVNVSLWTSQTPCFVRILSPFLFIVIIAHPLVTDSSPVFR